MCNTFFNKPIELTAKNVRVCLHYKKLLKSKRVKTFSKYVNTLKIIVNIKFKYS